MIKDKKNLSLNERILRNDSAFTLVELIVVIVILAILATIAFLSFSSQSASARDSTRLADMSNTAKGLSVYKTIGGIYPVPDKKVNIYSSGSLIGYQGEAGSSVLNIIKLSGGGRDPSKKTYYTYTTNLRGDKFELLGFLEAGLSNSYALFPNVADKLFATEYIDSLPYAKGDRLGIILYETGNIITPLQDTGTGIEIKSPGDNKVFISNDSSLEEIIPCLGLNFTSTGSVTVCPYDSSITYVSGDRFSYNGAIVDVSSTGLGISDSRFSGCDKNDLAVWQNLTDHVQIWSACNAGSSISGTGAASYGGYYQWGRNDNLSSTGTPTSVRAATGTLSDGVGHSNFITGSSPNTNWILVANNDLWGGVTNTNIARKGPCASGYHVPSYSDFMKSRQDIFLNDYNKFRNDLQFPMAGFRYYFNAGWQEQGTKAKYWTSTSQGGLCAQSCGFEFTWGFFSSEQENAYPVRCMKN